MTEAKRGIPARLIAVAAHRSIFAVVTKQLAFTTHARERMSGDWQAQLTKVAMSHRGDKKLGACKFGRLVDPRNISEAEVQEAVASGQRDGRRFQHDSLTVITDRSSQVVVTAFRQGVRPDRAQTAERNFIRQELKATMSSIPVESIPIVALKIAGMAKKKTLKDKVQRRQKSRDQKVKVLCIVGASLVVPMQSRLRA
jgi:hypothetical protein